MLSRETFLFLAQNRGENSREWFAAHRDDYETVVLRPLAELATAIAPAISEIDPQIVTEPKVDKTISRIYRDTRFSADKLLYREEAWLSFRRDKHAFPRYPEFFFVISPREYFWGCGYYAATAEAMDSVRAMILADTPEFRAARAAYEEQSTFVMDGECYKRSRYPAESPALRDWLDRKSICFMHRGSDFPLLYSDALPELICADFRRMAPLYRFFLAAELRAAELSFSG